MKRKLLIVLILLILGISQVGCTFKLGSMTIHNFTITSQKPNRYYYTNYLIRDLDLYSEVKIKLLDTNFYKEKDLTDDDIDTVKNLMKALKRSNFIEKPKDLAEKPIYKLFISFNNDKYIINVYSDQYISVYPWDGKYSMDYINMSGVQNLYNLYGLCKYVIPR